MKKLILIGLLLTGMSAYAQTEPTHVTYCELVGQGKLFSKKITVRVDYGEERKLFKDNRIKDESGKVETFNSMVDALNYMGEDGWVFVQAYVVTIGNENVYHWLLSKKI